MKRLFAISILLIFTACAAPVTITPTPSPASTATITPSPTPSATITPSLTITRTYYPTRTLQPTYTFAPEIATAAAKGECIASFQVFAYQGPIHRSHEWILPLPPWQFEAAIPMESFDGHVFRLNTALSRSINGYQEIWLRGYIDRDSRPFNSEDEYFSMVYRPDTQEWEIIPGNVEDTKFLVGDLWATSDGTLWATTEWNPPPIGQEVRNVPVLSRFNEETRRFEFVEGMLEIPLVTNYYAENEIILTDKDVFWIFPTVNLEGVYNYYPMTGVTVKQASNSGIMNYGVMASDGSFYVVSPSRQYVANSPRNYFQFVEGLLFHYIPEADEVISLAPPDEEEWPMFSGMLADHTGRIWLGSIGYIAPDGSWHLIHPHPEEWFKIVDEGDYSNVWDTPVPILESSDGRIWFYKWLNTGGWGEGTAWYDPETEEGCLFTNYAANIIEDSQQQLWLVADYKLYKYRLNPQ